MHGEKMELLVFKLQKENFNMSQREVTEQDFRMPEYRDAKPEDYEFRADGKLVRKDRWERGIRSIVGILGMSRDDFEIEDVVNLIKIMHEKTNKSEHYQVALKNIINEFETNFMVDGEVVDNPNIVITTMLSYAKNGLKEVKED